MNAKKLKCLLLLSLTLFVAGPVHASTDSGIAVAADAVIVRPFCLLATILGSAVFVVSLPFAATSHSIDESADALVWEPFDATFRRPMGDFESL